MNKLFGANNSISHSRFFEICNPGHTQNTPAAAAIKCLSTHVCHKYVHKYADTHTERVDGHKPTDEVPRRTESRIDKIQRRTRPTIAQP